MTTEFAVTNESAIASPALLLFSERIDRNIARMVEIAGGADRLRPHVKTHKLEPLIRRQLTAGITKFKTATIAEAEMCASAGAPDVLLAYPPAGPAGTRFCELMRAFAKTRFSIIADSAPAIRGLSVSARAAGMTVEVLLDLDVGMGRTGVSPGTEAPKLYRLIAETPGLRPGGLHAYDGHLTESDPAARRAQCDAAFAPVDQLRDQLRAEGLEVPLLVAGGTPSFPIHATHSDRECSPGTTVLWDFSYAEKYADLPFEIAAVLLTRVVSKPAMNRLCLDLGHKAVAAENPLATRMKIVEIPDAVAVMQSEEHLVVETARAKEFPIGQALHALPRHICPTVALHAEAIVVHGDSADDRWPIAARARRLTI
jgi:D-serine deaminase-like pyridoxal phosphate-dependent protein